MKQPVTQEWMENLGREDGAAVAEWVVEQLCSVDGPGDTQHIGKLAVRRVRGLARKYVDRGVSEALVDTWRRECVAEIYRRFTAIRAEAGNKCEQAPVSAPLSGSIRSSAATDLGRGSSRSVL